MKLEDLLSILHPYDGCPLEGHDLTRVLHTALAHLGLPHQVMVGCIRHVGVGLSKEPHCWIELPNGYIVDYRARMELGVSPEIPHGVFLLLNHQIQYDGMAIEMEPLPDSLFNVLTDLISHH